MSKQESYNNHFKIIVKCQHHQFNVMKIPVNNGIFG